MHEIRLPQAVRLLREMVAIPSPSFGENGVSALLFYFLAENGIASEAFGCNLLVRHAPYVAGRKTLMLCAHMDTVEPAEGYTFDPINPPLADDRVNGLGSNDDGGSVVSMLAAFSHYYGKELPVNLLLALTAEEERSGPDGMRRLRQALPGLGIRVDHAIVGEPTGMLAATSERGLLVLDGVAEGVSGHAARGEGVNALYLALDDIARIRAFPSAQVTQIHAGKAHNVIPDRCTFVVDVRPDGGQSNESVLAQLQAQCRSTLTPRNMANHSSATPADSVLLAIAGALGIPTCASPTTSDWMHIDCEAIKMGPGDSARSHRADEYVLISELEDAIDTYKRFIDKYIEIYG